MEPTDASAYRMLVIANETCPCPALLDEIARRAGTYDPHHVHIVAPALNSRLRHWLSDSDSAHAAAVGRLDLALEYLREAGIRVQGSVGDADPFVALDDALHGYDADEIMLSTHPPGQSHWLERNLVERVQAQVDIPVRHVVSAYGAVR